MSTSKLPTFADHLQSLEHCRFCPMCKPKGEVSLVSRHEVHTTRTRAMLLWRIAAGHEPWSDRVGELVYEASLDSSSEAFCVGHIPVSSYIVAARAEAIRKGAAPDVVVEIEQRWRQASPTGLPGPVRRLVYNDIEDMRPSLPEELGQAEGVLAPHGLSHAFVLGFEDLFRDRARMLHDAIVASGAVEAVADGPATQFALTVLLDRAGVPLNGVAVTTATSALTPRDGVADGPPAYVHDSSYARLAGTGPEGLRSDLARLGVPVLEFRERGLLADDVGVEGGLHLTHPTLATMVARRRLNALPDASHVITDCPTSAAWLKQVAGGAHTILLVDEYVRRHGHP